MSQFRSFKSHLRLEYLIDYPKLPFKFILDPSAFKMSWLPETSKMDNVF